MKKNLGVLLLALILSMNLYTANALSFDWFINQKAKRYLNNYYYAENETDVNIYHESRYGQMWDVYYDINDNGPHSYKYARFEADTSNYGYCLNAYGSAPKAGADVTLWECDPMNSTKLWILEKVGEVSQNYSGDNAHYYAGDGIYVIRSKYNSNLVLTAKGTGDKADVRLEPYYKGSDKNKKALQRWIRRHL